ncbi:MAG: neutral/alkaline non-lysosomal ceramidase N-terminal domain-containing protein [Myxococcota bacterium]
MIILLLLLACTAETTPRDASLPRIRAGAPVAGVAEAPIDFPMGAPLGGYTNRCLYLGNAANVDGRESDYTLAFGPSAGIQTRAMAKALWLENGDQHLVILKADVIYSFDGLVEAVEDALHQATGEDLDGRVTLTTSHTHNAPANFSDQVPFYLGGDKYNEEVFQRFAASLTAVALDAYTHREPAKLGVGIARDWDPDDQIYSDRRGENNDLVVWPDGDPATGKDPHLWVMRVDDLDGAPMGLFFNFGIHGIMLDADNPLVSVDSTGHIEMAVEDAFDAPVVVAHWQGAGGDASPRGRGEHGHRFAKMEGLGELAVGPIIDLWTQTPTAAEPITLETVTRAIPQDLETIRVTRDGTVDWRYATDGGPPDEILYEPDGSLRSPFDEFAAPVGAVFCGESGPLGNIGTLQSRVPPYDSCVEPDTLEEILENLFDIQRLTFPLPSTLRANTTAARLGPLPIRDADGQQVHDDLLIGFFPGETAAMYAEQYRRRSKAELGYDYAMVVGYAQDHEGYLLIPEDWMTGGYEASINLWGPLQGEHLLEQNLIMADAHLNTDVLEPQDPNDEWQPTVYEDRPLPVFSPDRSATAGQLVDTVPEGLFVPLDGVTPQPQPDDEIVRFTGLAQLVWEGGDPSVDLPIVTLEVQGDGGEWSAVTTPSGRPLTDARPDILLTHTPQDGRHFWWAGWQAVGWSDARQDLPAGTYRLHVEGQRLNGDEDRWPWRSEGYSLTSAPFTVVPAEITLVVGEDEIRASLVGPSWGYRLIDIDGSSQGDNPLASPTLTWEFEDGTTMTDVGDRDRGSGTSVFDGPIPEGVVRGVVEDGLGNSATLVP